MVGGGRFPLVLFSSMDFRSSHYTTRSILVIFSTKFAFYLGECECLREIGRKQKMGFVWVCVKVRFGFGVKIVFNGVR